MTRTIVGAMALMVAALTLPGCSAMFDKLADTILANEVRLDDREAPPTAHAVRPSADPVQILGGQGQGLSCSLPPGAQELAFTRTGGQAPIALQMRQACAFHDYCYRHGNATYGYSQTDCDNLLQQQAFRLCQFIHTASTISNCETNARKVVLAVRLGGAGNFKRARAPKAEHASTFFEFDPYPARAQAYRVVRVADAPRAWVNAGALAKAAYMFDMRPSGTHVSVVGWREGGAVVCAAFELPARFDAMNAPPMVVRDAPSGEDWLVWWRRHDLARTGGRFALLAPGRATGKDWAEAAGGFTRADQGNCNQPWPNEQAPAAAPPAAFVSGEFDDEFSELHPVPAADSPGLLRLLGLTTHSKCRKNLAALMCLMDVRFDTTSGQVKLERATYPIVEAKAECHESCGDRYRNYVTAPFIVAGPTPRLLWIRRGTGNGTGYETTAMVRRYELAPTHGAQADYKGNRYLTGFKEDLEPAALIDDQAAGPTFLSVVAGKKADDALQVTLRRAVAHGEPSPGPAALSCMKETDPSWLMRPAMLARGTSAGEYQLVMTRVLVPALDVRTIAVSDLRLSATLEVSVTVLSADGTHCEAGAKQQFRVFATAQEKNMIAKSLADRDECTRNPAGCTKQAAADDAQRDYDRFVARTRGGQLVLADVTNDKVPDLVFVSRLPSLQVDSAVLVGSMDKRSPLRFAQRGTEPQ